MAPSLLRLLVKDNDRSMSLTAHSQTMKFGKFHGSALNYSLTMHVVLVLSSGSPRITGLRTSLTTRNCITF